MNLPGQVRCRQIHDADVPALVKLLCRGFQERGTAFWAHAFRRLGERPVPAGAPTYGYLLESVGVPVGVILTIHSTGLDGCLRCNLSSWFVEPDYRAYAGPLISAATRRKDVTYINISPAPHTWPLIEAQGFVPYADTVSALLPSLARSPSGAAIERFTPGSARGSDLAGPLRELMVAHAGFGCMTLVARTEDKSVPLIVQRRRVGGLFVPGAQLIFASDMQDLARFAGPLSRFLLRHGIPVLTCDADQPLPGWWGPYRRRRAGRKYFKGPRPPNLADLTFTERVMFGA